MGQRVLFLDDSNSRYMMFKRNIIGASATLDRASTAAEAIELLSVNPYDIICLDHDLDIDLTTGDATAVESNTGMDVVRELIRFEHQKQAVILIQSLNEPASQEMKSILEQNGFEVYLKPFLWTSVRVTEDRMISF